MQTNPNINLTMLCDFYELTMANGYFRSGMQDKITYFDLFFRKVPDEGGFAIAAGLEQAIEYIQNLHFGEDDIAYLRSRDIFGEDFLVPKGSSAKSHREQIDILKKIFRKLPKVGE